MKKLILVVLMSLSVLGTLQFASPSAFAQFDSAKNEACEGLAAGDDFISCEDNSGNDGNVKRLLSTLLNLLSILAGIIAVVMVMIGGIRFMTSQGDPGKVSSAKSAVIFAIIGVVVVAVSQTLVMFVLDTTSKAVVPDSSQPQRVNCPTGQNCAQ